MKKQMKEKLKMRRDRKTQNMKFFRQSLCWKKWRVQKRRLKRSRTNHHFPIFLQKKKTRRKRKHKGTFFKDQQTRKTVFSNKKETVRTETIQKTWLLVKKGEYVKGELEKKRNTMIKPNRVFKKMRYIKGSDWGKNIQERELKRRMFKNTWE